MLLGPLSRSWSSVLAGEAGRSESGDVTRAILDGDRQGLNAVNCGLQSAYRGKQQGWVSTLQPT